VNLVNQSLLVSRIHQSWLAERERRLLIWLAGRLPAWTSPDQLTALGLAGAFLCGASFWCSTVSPRFLWLAGLGLIINWFGDSLDGTLARQRGIERPHYGFFIDHTTDVVSQAFIFLGLGASPYMRFDMACLMLMSYWIAALYTFIRAISTRIFQISYFGIGPTEIRLGLLFYVFFLLTFGRLSVITSVGPVSPLDAFAAIIFLAVFVSFLSMIWSEGHRLSALDAITSQARPPAELGLEVLEAAK
jgi:phosphatidylglycerophosphate synthase